MNHNDPTQWPAGTEIRIVKLAVADDAQYQTCSWENWKIGEDNDGSPPIDYEVRGLLIEPLEIGKPILLIRTHRNNVQAMGSFISTPVRLFKKGAAITLNSVYFISRDEADPML